MDTRHEREDDGTSAGHAASLLVDPHKRPFKVRDIKELINITFREIELSHGRSSSLSTRVAPEMASHAYKVQEF